MTGAFASIGHSVNFYSNISAIADWNYNFPAKLKP